MLLFFAVPVTVSMQPLGIFFGFVFVLCVAGFCGGFAVQVAFTERAREMMGGLKRSQKFLDVSKTDVCGKMASLEVSCVLFSGLCICLFFSACQVF